MAVLQDPATTALFSVVSVWEILIKLRPGKLSLQIPLAQIVAHQQENGIGIVPVSLQHALSLEDLPAIHKDPFDRLLICQANVEGAVLLSADRILDQYPVHVVW